MIRGIGIDVIEIPRIEESLKRHGKRFISRIATSYELEHAPTAARRTHEYWAARFAAKEAFAKALGTGIGKTVSWKSVGVRKNKRGRPELECSPRVSAALRKLGITNTHLAITHTARNAVAVVILEGN